MIKKTITYSGFTLAILMIVVIFVTSRSFTQLSLAVLVYPLIVYFLYKIFMGKSEGPVVSMNLPSIAPEPSQTDQNDSAVVESPNNALDGAIVTDIEKRAFLKLLGAAGLSVVVYSLINRKFDTVLFGGSQSTNINNQPMQPTAGFTISEIDNDGSVTYFGFVNSSGAWYIMKEDLNMGTYRYTEGRADFNLNWSHRTELTYDYYQNVFPESN